MNANTAAIKTLTAGRAIVRAAGSGLPCSVIVTLLAAGRLSVRRTGAATIYTLKGAK